jgi:DNA replication initiation complex subunit (GINS family)
MITFKDIYEILRKEKYSDSLQPLNKKFLKEIKEYLESKQEFLSKEDNLFNDLAIKNKKKLENAQSSLKDLLRIRKKKILNLAFVANEVGISKKDFENMLSFEKSLFEGIVKSLEKADKEKNSEMKNESEPDAKHKLVRFLEEVPAFLNIKGEEVGPFAKGEISNMEAELVDFLNGDNRIEVIDEEC